MRSEGISVYTLWLSTFLLVGALRHSASGMEPLENSDWPKYEVTKEEEELEDAAAEAAFRSDLQLLEVFDGQKSDPVSGKRSADSSDKSENTIEACGPTSSFSLVGKTSVDLFSPNIHKGDLRYAINLNCNYTVTAEVGYNLVIDVTYIDVEATGNCRYDHIMIFDSQGILRHTLCGSTPVEVSVDGNEILINFVSDFYMSLTGFNMTIRKTLQSDCSSAPSVQYADVTSAGTTAGSQATYKCITGFILQGNDKILCLPNGNWETPPTCIEVTCNKPVISDSNAIPLYTSTRYGANMTFSCGDTHMLKDPSALLTCMANGNWEGLDPECVGINCGMAPSVSNAILVSNTGINVGDVASYICADGFNNAGGQTLLCSGIGSWIPYSNDIDCQPVQCPLAPSVPVNGMILYENGSVYESMVTYACKEGYYLVNVRGTEYTIYCTATGRWDKEAPKCDMSLCGGLIIKTELSPGGVLTSPNYPDNYSPKRNCTWVIQAPNPGHRITFEIEDMQIEYSEDCIYDRLNLYESNGKSHTKIGTYCGATRPPTIVTLGNFLIVNLFSDEAEVHRGFKASYYFSPARDRDDIQAAALKYYSDLVQRKLMDAKLDHWVEAVAYIRSYKWTVDSMFDHSNCLFLLESFDGLFHLLDDHVIPLLGDYVDITLTRVIFNLNPTNASVINGMSVLIANGNVTTLVRDARTIIEDLRIEVARSFGNVTKGSSNFPTVPEIFEALHEYLIDTVYPNRKVMGALSVATEIVDMSDTEVKALLNIGIWDSPVCPPLVETVEYLTEIVKTNLDKLLLLLHDAVVKQNILDSFGLAEAHLAELFHDELTEQLHVLHSPFEIMAIAWNRLKDIELSQLNDTSDIGVPEHGEGQISEAELLMHSTEPTAAGLYKDILEEHVSWMMDEFLEREIIEKIYSIAPSLLDVSIKDVDEAHIQGMLTELMLQLVQHMPGTCQDAKLVAMVAGLAEASLVDLIRQDLDITNLTFGIASIAWSDFVIPSAEQPIFAALVADNYRSELHQLFMEEVHHLEDELESITHGRIATETIPMLAFIKAIGGNTATFRELIRDIVHVFVPPMILNVSCPGVDYFAELRPALHDYVEALQVPNVLDRLLQATIGSYGFSGGAVAYIREQIRDHYSMVLEKLMGRINRLNIPNHHDLAKQTLTQFILDKLAAKLYEAIDLWKPDIPVTTTPTPGPLPVIVADDLAAMVLTQQNDLNILVGQVVQNMRNMITLLGGGQDACLTYPAICAFSISHSIR